MKGTGTGTPSFKQESTINKGGLLENELNWVLGLYKLWGLCYRLWALRAPKSVTKAQTAKTSTPKARDVQKSVTLAPQGGGGLGGWMAGSGSPGGR